MSAKNIQRLFASITHQSICQYMHQSGWSSMERGERLDFQKQRENGEGPQTVYITAREDHPKFRSLVPNLVFSLSVLEEREAYSVAESIYRVAQEFDRKGEAPSVDSIASQPSQAIAPLGSRRDFERSRWIRIRNGTSASIEVVWGQRDNPTRLRGGETMFIDPTDWELGLEVQGDVRIFGEMETPGSNPRLLLDLPGRRISSPSLVEQEILRILRSEGDLENALSHTTTDSVRDDWVGLIRRFFFTNGVNESVEATLPTRQAMGPLLRSVAMLLADISERLDARFIPSSSLFEVSRWLLAMWGITFSADPNAPLELCTALLSDRGNPPTQTFEWLEANTVRIQCGGVDRSIP